MTKAEKECIEAYNKFNRTRNFSKDVKNCVWDFDIELPEPPSDPKKIANFGKAKKDRTFPYIPVDEIRRLDRLPMTDPEKLEHIEVMWDRRRNGFWFYNGDNLEWVTGYYYMTLQYWLIPIEDLDGGFGQPKFIDMHRDMTYAIWWTKEHEDHTGICYVGCRRSGKSMMGMAHGYWDTTERYNALFGIQSKTDGDAKEVLWKLVGSWQRLPDFLKPVDTGYTTVSRELTFAEPQKKSSKGKKREYKEVLNSRIYAYSSKETAMDGTRQTFQFQDEFGKRKDSDAYKTQQISKVCSVVGRKKVGFAFWATTVEEMEKEGGAAAKKIWDGSNPRKLNQNGRTTTTLIRLFFPAEYGLIEGGFIDPWGYSLIDEASKWLDAEESSLDGDDLLDWKRKFPRHIDDAFVIPRNANSYNQRKLYEQYTYNDRLDPKALPVRGNFMWAGGRRDTMVEFYPNPDGRWLVAWMPPEEDRNRKEQFGGHWRPTREYCRVGADPFAHRAVTEEGSKGAAYTILKSHYKFPKMKMAWVCQYLYRQTHPHEQAEDMLMQCVFYSAPFLCEKNVYGVLDYFEQRGYDGYCLFNPLDEDSVNKRIKGHRGMPMTGTEAGQQLGDITQAHIEDFIGYDEVEQSYGYCPFNELISDWQQFDPNKRTKFDAAMAAGMALIACQTPEHKQQKGFTQNDWLGATKKLGRVKFSKDGIDRFRSS